MKNHLEKSDILLGGAKYRQFYRVSPKLISKEFKFQKEH